MSNILYLPSVLGYLLLAAGIILLIASIVTFIKIKQGSKSQFAYLLICFTFGNGTIFILTYFDLTFWFINLLANGKHITHTSMKLD